MALQEPAPRSSVRLLWTVPILVWLTLVICLAMTGLAWYSVKTSSEQAAADVFRRLSQEIGENIVQRMLAYEQVLRGGVALFEASDTVTRADWRHYVGKLQIEENFPGIQGIGFAKVIRPHELARHIAEIRAEGFPDYTLRPPGERELYTSIVYLEPFNRRNRAAFGYDMFSEPTRNATMSLARDSGQTAVSGKVILKQEITRDVQNGFLMYLPLYRKGVALETVEQRRAALLGYVYSPFRVNNFMQGTLGEKQTDLDLRLYDGSEALPDRLIYQSKTRAEARPEFVPRFQGRQSLGLPGHAWLLEIRSTSLYEANIDSAKHHIVAAAGLIISLLLTAFVWSLVTRRQRAQALADAMTTTVREREAFIQAIVDHAADGIVVIDQAGRILSFNHAAEAIFGHAAAEVIGQNVKMLMPEPDSSRHDGYIARYLRTGEKTILGARREVAGLRKNGEIFPLDLAVSEVYQTGGRVFAGMMRDITERKQAEEALRASEERFDLAIRGANDGLWDWNLKNNTVYYSPRWKEMLGYADYEVSPSLEEWSSRVHPDDLEPVMAAVRAHLDGKTSLYMSEHRIRHKDGHYLWILDRGIAQRGEQGRPQRMVGIHTDISERKRMEKMKNEFVSTVSHELRTPLTAIRGSLGLIAGGMTGELPQQAKELIDMAAANTERLLALINDLLDMDKIQSGALQFDLKAQEIMPLVEQAVANNRSYAEQYGVTYLLEAGLPGVMARVDAARFIQVMANLLSNAAKFSRPGGSVEVAVKAEDDSLRVSVTDHGVGISESFRDRIFEKFSQGDSSDTRHKGGTGLGLSISKSLIEKMGGQIGFDSQLGQGSTFYFTLPVVRPGSAE
ncbi:MAG: CHASE domain-containing protein [Hydrogenophilaceae bacterium]|nr:CHASE domain-containing protein [Hydrogenophilaceae bacterium]